MPRGTTTERAEAQAAQAADPAVLGAYLTPTHLNWLATEPNRSLNQLEASLLFADVSGFTNLGERLARRGRIGAEQLTDAINVVFGAMVTVIGSGGGELVKFGGDAVLGLFTGDAHEQRATGAAVGIQDALAAIRPLDGRRNGERLQVSAGVASGTAHLFLAGAAPRELIVAGPLASLVTSLESAANAGEVLVSDRTRAALPASCAGERRGDGTLVAAPPPLVHGQAPRRIPEADPLSGLPVHLHDHEPTDGEHRTASIGFLQIRGTDALLAAKGGGALAEALDEIVGAVCEACRAWGVTLVSTDVDSGACKLILCAGAPVASPDDDDRIIHALLSLTERSWPLPVRAGVNRGQAFTGDLGTPDRRVWSVMGDAVNLAARVMGKAADGELLATEAALARVRDDFARTPVEPFKVKGKAHPVKAATVGGALGVARAAPAADAPLVGRDREVGTLREALAVARTGGRRIVELVGEPGIGKSRLVQAALDEAEGLNIVRIQAGPYGAQTPYLAMRSPLRAAAGIPADASEEVCEARITELVSRLEPELAKWLPLIALPFGIELEPTPETETLEPEFARQRLHSGIAYFLDLLLPERPSLVVVEDAHWLDDASAALLRHLMTADRETGPRHEWGADSGSPAHAAAGVASVVTRRPVADGMDLEGVPVTTIELEPLSLEDARLLVLADDLPLGPAERREILARSEGNPLLLQELLAAVRAGGSLEELPDSVEALMTARIDTLPRRERLLLRDAAVLGIYVPIEELTEMLGAEPRMMQTTLEPLRGEFFVEEAPHALRFRHALLRSAAYNTLSFKRRRELHGRAAEIIVRRAGGAEEAEPELLAIHYHAAGLWEESWRHSRLAGERALRNAAPVEAADFFAGALEASRHVRGVAAADRAAVAEALGDAAEFAGDYERAASAFSRAAKLRRDDPLAKAGLCLKQGQIAESSRHLSGALRWFTRGLGNLPEGEESKRAQSLRAQLVLAHGATRLRAGRLRECVAYLQEAVEAAKRCGDRPTLAHAYYLLEWAYTDLELPEAERYRDLALPIYEELGDHTMQGRVLNNLGVTAYYESRWTDAVDFYERARAAAEKSGDAVKGVGTALMNIAEIRIDQGRTEEAEELLREALSIWRAARSPFNIGTSLKNLGRIATRRGEFDRAAELFAKAREEFERVGADSLIAETSAWELERLVVAGEGEKARALVERIDAETERRDLVPALRAAIERLAGQAELLGGNREAAIARLTRSAELAAKAEARFDEALAELELAHLGVRDAGAKMWARETLAELGVSL